MADVGLAEIALAFHDKECVSSADQTTANDDARWRGES
jgi:hypothetical protein